jgi:uncharacterized protein YneF (UPF0154 family)
MQQFMRFFDKLEDHVREWLSRRPLIYTFVGSFAIVLFWKGVWDTADMVPFLTGPVSILISVSVLLVTGLFVSFFVGDIIIMSGIKKEKKLIEKTELEMKGDEFSMMKMRQEMHQIKRETDEVKHLLVQSLKQNGN